MLPMVLAPLLLLSLLETIGSFLLEHVGMHMCVCVLRTEGLRQAFNSLKHKPIPNFESEEARFFRSYIVLAVHTAVALGQQFAQQQTLCLRS